MTILVNVAATVGASITQWPQALAVTAASLETAVGSCHGGGFRSKVFNIGCVQKFLSDQNSFKLHAFSLIVVPMQGKLGSGPGRVRIEFGTGSGRVRGAYRQCMSGPPGP